MLVDPRPFTYQYRKPRLLNPTYQSRGLYESLYHRYPQEYNDYYPQQQQKQIVRYDSYDRKEKNHSEKKEIDRKMTDIPKATTQNVREVREDSQTINRNPQRQKEAYKLPSIGRQAERNRVSSSFQGNAGLQNGDSLAIKNRRGFERFRIYQRQQKPYNIISCYPKQKDDNQLRLFPKLTLEDRLIERGSYHTLRQQ